MVVATLEPLMMNICSAVLAGPVIELIPADCVLNGVKSTGVCTNYKFRTNLREWPLESHAKMPS